jgi:hypothetical protein
VKEPSGLRQEISGRWFFLEILFLVTLSLCKLKAQKYEMKKPPSQDQILGAVVLILIFGSVVLAIIDPSTRPTFGDLTKVVVGTYIGIHIPPPNKRG